ncbi:MAG: invasion associated locus B family protein [Pikeienuella sp.]
MRAFILVLATILFAGAASAQSAPNGAKFGDWTLICKAEGVGETNCYLAQRIINKESGALISEVRLTSVDTDAGRKTHMLAFTPDGVELSKRSGYVVDKATTQVALHWRSCAQKICRAEAFLTAEQTAALKAGAKMLFGYQKFRAKKPVVFPLSLTGVSAGLLALSNS